MLMSVITSVAFAQAPKMEEDCAKMSERNVCVIEKSLLQNTYISEQDRALVKKLLQQNNAPVEGVIVEDESIVPKTQAGDKWVAYISDNDSLWLTYIVSRDGHFFARLDIRLN